MRRYLVSVSAGLELREKGKSVDEKFTCLEHDEPDRAIHGHYPEHLPALRLSQELLVGLHGVASGSARICTRPASPPEASSAW